MEEILRELERRTKKERKDLEKKIEERQQKLSGLISREGAAYLVAKELGIDLPAGTKRKLDMANIIPGMKNVNTFGRVFKVSDIVEFGKGTERPGKVVNLYIGDGTGSVRLPLWNDQVKLVEDELIKIGDVVQIVNGFARTNIFGDIEISLGRYGSIKAVEEELELPTVEELNQRLFGSSPKEAKIKDIASGSYQIKGTIVHVFKGGLFYTCPLCGGSLKDGICGDHGKVEPTPALVLSCILDDSSSDLRAVFFRELAEKLLGKSAAQFLKLSEEEREGLIFERLLGRELTLSGRVKKNRLFDRLEMIVDEFKDLNILEESDRLVRELEVKVS
jgi:ssDNA-binding replication factor A large subunit